MNGRTENSIKNYFYSTIRRIQASRVFDYFVQLKNGENLTIFDNLESFAEHYEVKKINQLGYRIVIFLWDVYMKKIDDPNYGENEEILKSLIAFLEQIVIDDSKKTVKTKKPKNDQSDGSHDKHEKSVNLNISKSVKKRVKKEEIFSENFNNFSH